MERRITRNRCVTSNESSGTVNVRRNVAGASLPQCVLPRDVVPAPGPRVLIRRRITGVHDEVFVMDQTTAFEVRPGVVEGGDFAEVAAAVIDPYDVADLEFGAEVGVFSSPAEWAVGIRKRGSQRFGAPGHN
jgi:hypothetical protein